jgi:hypothetical protein
MGAANTGVGTPYAGTIVPLGLAFPQRQTSYFNSGGLGRPFSFDLRSCASDFRNVGKPDLARIREAAESMS